MYFHPLNFIRFLLAVGVILFHYGVSYFPFNQPAIKTLIVNSSFRVSFFFFISGFVMCMVYASRLDFKAKDFYKRRITRIYPVYWLAFVWTILVVLFISNASPKGLNIILHALGLQSLNPGHVLDLNYPTWSISVELIFYLIFPFLLKWIMKFSAKKLIVIASFIWFLQSLQHFVFVEYLYNGTKAMEEFISTFPLWHFSTFFVGMVAARLIELNAFQKTISKNTFLFLALALILFLYIIFVPNPILKYVHNGLLSPLFLLFIVALYYDRSFLHKALSNKRVSSLGDLSYGLFIFQYPLWVICTKIFSKDFIKSGWFFLIYFVILLITAFIVNKFFEKPMLRRLRKE